MTSVLPDDVSPDRRLLVYRDENPVTNNDPWILPLDGSGEAYPILRTAADEPRARFSPDGRLIGYISKSPAGSRLSCNHSLPWTASGRSARAGGPWSPCSRLRSSTTWRWTGPPASHDQRLSGADSLAACGSFWRTAMTRDEVLEFFARQQRAWTARDELGILRSKPARPGDSDPKGAAG
jgi:hypothetical protein